MLNLNSVLKVLLSFAVVTASASSTRTDQVDLWKSADLTKTWTPPAATDTIVGRLSTDTLTNKSISGSTNTITNVSLTTGVTGTLPYANGGTNQTTANAALNGFLPSQSGNSTKFLQTDGTNTSWATPSGGGGGGTTSSVQKLTTTGTQIGWVFYVANFSGSIQSGDTYTNNGNTYTAVAPANGALMTGTASWFFWASGTGATSGGTLTKAVSASGPATMTFTLTAAIASVTTSSTRNTVKITAVGGGGSGGNSVSSASQCSAGGGGGGGGTVITMISTADLAGSLTQLPTIYYAVGTGGSGAAAAGTPTMVMIDSRNGTGLVAGSGAAGGAGSTTNVAAITANDAQGGVDAGSGSGRSMTFGSSQPATIFVTGGNGNFGFCQSTSYPIGGYGGSTFLSPSTRPNYDAIGAPGGVSYGGGGAGATSKNGGSSSSVGNGAPGLVLLEFTS